MKVYIFGNRDLLKDNGAFKVAEKMGKDLRDIEFVEVKPNEDLPFANGQDVVIMDVVEGLDKVRLIDPSGRTPQDDVSVVLPPRNSVHDFDLGFQLKYLQKLGKLGKVTIIGIPQTGEIDYDSIHSIFRKLVAQDMQGS